MNFENVEEFFPTPRTLWEKISKGIRWNQVGTILEPSAGKGDMVEYIKDTIGVHLDIDCIEINPELQSVLQGKNLRLVHDDFLTFRTFKQYDLIIMNPPFRSGVAHLTKALDMQKDGGAILCILNAWTLKNPNSKEKQALLRRLISLNAEIEYLKDEFVSAERPTGIEIAVIKVFIEKKQYKSFIYESLRQKSYSDELYKNVTDLAPSDFIEAIITMYNTEAESGVKLIREYQAMCPYIMKSIQNSRYNEPILSMKVGNEELSTNTYLKWVRRKYWNALLNNPKLTGNMTSNLIEAYQKQVENLSNYDFSHYNVKCIQEELMKGLVKGIEDCIISLFDELSYQYSYSNELSQNIHYYNGWTTNKAWIINRKVILPFMNAFGRWDRSFYPSWDIEKKLMDIEKALNYLDGGLTDALDLREALKAASKTGQTKKIRLKYFLVTFYKKGTCHIEFTNLELLKKLNIFGSQQKKWLPPGYGKKTYQEMDTEEQAVVDEFEGAESYQKTLAKADYFIYDPKGATPMIEVNDV